MKKQEKIWIFGGATALALAVVLLLSIIIGVSKGLDSEPLAGASFNDFTAQANTVAFHKNEDTGKLIFEVDVTIINNASTSYKVLAQGYTEKLKGGEDKDIRVSRQTEANEPSEIKDRKVRLLVIDMVTDEEKEVKITIPDEYFREWTTIWNT